MMPSDAIKELKAVETLLRCGNVNPVQIAARIKSLLPALEQRERFVCEEIAKHIPMSKQAGPEDPSWLISWGYCSCGKMEADGVTPWNNLWTDHLRAALNPEVKP
jgi:hypothetical protein